MKKKVVRETYMEPFLEVLMLTEQAVITSSIEGEDDWLIDDGAGDDEITYPK